MFVLAIKLISPKLKKRTFFVSTESLLVSSTLLVAKFWTAAHFKVQCVKLQVCTHCTSFVYKTLRASSKRLHCKITRAKFYTLELY